MTYTERIPHDPNSLGVLGYVVTVNKQVHSYQVALIEEYLNQFGMSIETTVLACILNGYESEVTLDLSLDAFAEEDYDAQATILSLAFQLSSVDGYIDSAEEYLIERIVNRTVMLRDDIRDIASDAKQKAKEYRVSRNGLFETPFQKKSCKKGLLRKTWDLICRFFCWIFRLEAGKEKKSANEEYISAIEQCSVVAKEDYSIISPAYDRVLGKCEETIERIETIKQDIAQENDLAIQIGRFIKIFADSIANNVSMQISAAKEALLQKERSLPDFTISLIGRTKAGKTTLHSILTNEGHDKIGKGLQRTTRYNRIYQWNLLRLIDTPGIGSAEDEGREDERITEGVLGESDIICFVIADDSIPEDLLDFIGKVAKMNKPIVILLNHKENIKPEPKFKRFIKNPNEWLETHGETDLQGHVNRIMRRAQKDGFEHQIRVFPVFLLAALMAKEEDYSKYHKILWRSSNIDVFIEQLKWWIVKSGAIKRSQTLLDETINSFANASRDVELAKQLVEERCTELKNKRPKTRELLREEQEVLLKNIKGLLTEKYAELAQQKAMAFAEEYYGQKKDVSESWQEYLRKIKFEQHLRSDIDAYFKNFGKKLETEICEVFEDFGYSFNLSTKMGHFSRKITIDFRSITKILGNILDLAGSLTLLILGSSNPVGWVLMGLGVVIGVGSNLFKSKAQKRQEAIDRLYQLVKSNIEQSASSSIDNCVNEIRISTNQLIERIDGVFADLATGLEDTVAVGEELSQAYEEEILMLNRIYAWRIIEYINGRTSMYSQDSVDAIVHTVDRSDSKEIRIVTKNEVGNDASSLTGVLAEKITILTMEEE